MNKQITFKIAGLILTVMTLLQFIPVYAEGTAEQPQALETEQQAINPYQISVPELLSVNVQLANKLLYNEQELLIPDMMNARTIINQVKARRAILVEKLQAEALAKQKDAKLVESKSARIQSEASDNDTDTTSKTIARSSSNKTSTVSRNTITLAGRSYAYKKVLQMQATAYTADTSENGQWGAVDALGNALKLGTVAVDPNVIPLGTKLFITGYQFKHLPHGGYLATASDTGGAIKGNKIDLFVPVSKETGSLFGNQNISVYVLK